jgi:hypothetical protein
MAQEISDRIRLARRDPASAGIYYATAESQIAHEALLDLVQARLESFDADLADAYQRGEADNNAKWFHDMRQDDEPTSIGAKFLRKEEQ